MKLFAIFLGGTAPGSIVEVHDVRFAIADAIEDTYEQLRQSWWGQPESLHLDCYGELTSTTDGYDVTLSPAKPATDDKLYFVNLGGYEPGDFGEVHRNVFVVAHNRQEAKRIALHWCDGWRKPHRDFVFEVENAFCINDITLGHDLHIHLTKTDTPHPFKFRQAYVPIGQPLAT